MMSDGCHRHPRCVTPPVGLPTASDFTAVQSAEIVRLDGELANARARIAALGNELHDANRDRTLLSCSLELVAIEMEIEINVEPAALLSSILEVHRKLAAAAVALEMLAPLLGLDTGAAPRAVVEAAIARLR